MRQFVGFFPLRQFIVGRRDTGDFGPKITELAQLEWIVLVKAEVLLDCATNEER
jgi:hypothetical protein